MIFLLLFSLKRCKIHNVLFIFPFRLNPLITPPVEKSPAMSLSLQEAIIVGAASEQAKFR